MHRDAPVRLGTRTICAVSLRPMGVDAGSGRDHRS
jgi:hypothetical protein